MRHESLAVASRPAFSGRSLVIASVLAATVVSAQNQAENPTLIKPEQDPPPSRNHFGLSYRMGLNISARFKNLGGYAAPRRLTPNGDVWNYDNGYNLDDGAVTPPDMTLYWGYVSKSQVPGDGFLYLSQSTSAADVVSSSTRNDPQHGLELTYNRDLGQVGRGHWGLEAALNFMNVSIQNTEALSGSVTSRTNAYSLLGNTVPDPDPDQGGYFQPNSPPGVVISHTAISMSAGTTPGGATVTGQRKIEAEVYGLRLGPFIEFPVYKELSLSLGGGLSLAAVHGKFNFAETVTIPGLNPISSSGSGSQSSVLAGGYAGLNLTYAFTKSWSAFVGGQYQYLGHFSQTANGKVAELDFSKSVFVNAGVGFSF